MQKKFECKKKIECKKLNNFGIRGRALDLIKPHLQNRGFHKEVQDRVSQPNSLDDIGVPGGLTWTLVGQLVK